VALDPISAVLDVGKTLIERFIPDPKQKAEALLKLREMEQSGDLQVIANQIEINKIEAASPRLFVSGWRPFIGWVCGAALALQLIIIPLAVYGANLAGKPVPAPVMSVELLTTMVISMLGIGGMRTYEKKNGVASQ
jgi:hypothetical protein